MLSTQLHPGAAPRVPPPPPGNSSTSGALETPSVSSLAPAGVSSFHWRGGGRRRAGGSASFTVGFGLGLPPALGVLVPREAFAKASQRVPRLRPVRLGPWRRAPPGRAGRHAVAAAAALALGPRPRPPLAGRGRRGRGAAPPSPPRRRRAAILPSCLRRRRRVSSQATQDSHRRLSVRSLPAATPPPSRVSASRRRAGKEPLIFGVSPARRAPCPRPGCPISRAEALRWRPEVAGLCGAAARAWRVSETGSLAPGRPRGAAVVNG